MEWLVFLVSLVPFVELRGALPAAVALGYSQESALLWCVLLNIAAVPAAFAMLDLILPRLCARSKKISGLFEWAKRRAEPHRNLTLGMLTIFVAVPLPGSGAYSGSLIAYMTGMKRSRAFAAISTGVVLAGFIVYALIKLGAYIL
jgi:uncharacterized membrane protein